MKEQLRTLLRNNPPYEKMGLKLNAFMITQYQLSFPQREFTFKRWIISDRTKAKTAYYDMIRRLCHLLNIRCLRDESNGFLYLVGRKMSVYMAAEIMDLMIGGTEDYVIENVRDWPMLRTAHKSTRKSVMRRSLIGQFNDILETIIRLKNLEYYDKYSHMRQVKSCELMDNTFFREYYREQRLTHLKPFASWLATNSANFRIV